MKRKILEIKLGKSGKPFAATYWNEVDESLPKIIARIERENPRIVNIVFAEENLFCETFLLESLQKHFKAGSKADSKITFAPIYEVDLNTARFEAYEAETNLAMWHSRIESGEIQKITKTSTRGISNS